MYLTPAKKFYSKERKAFRKEYYKWDKMEKNRRRKSSD